MDFQKTWTKHDEKVSLVISLNTKHKKPKIKTKSV